MAEGRNNNSFGWPSSSDNIRPCPDNDERAMDVPEPKRKRFNALHVVKRIFRRKSKPPLKKDQEQSSNIKSRSTGELAVLVANCSDKKHTVAASSNRGSESQDDSLSAPYNGMSLSHDSVFVPEDDHSQLSPIKRSNQKNFFNADINKELADRIRARRVGADSDDDDAGLPHSPSTSPTTADILHQGLTKKSKQFRSSDGSLLSMGSSETEYEDGSASANLLFDCAGADPDLDVGTTVLLNSQAARHKIAIRPRRNRSTVPSPRSSQTVVVGSTLPSTPEDNEDLVVTHNKNKAAKPSPPTKVASNSPLTENSTLPPAVGGVAIVSKKPSFEETTKVSRFSEIRVTENYESDVQRVYKSVENPLVVHNVRKSRESASNIVEKIPSPVVDNNITADVDSNVSTIIRQEARQEEEKTSVSCFNFSRTTKKESFSANDKLDKNEPQSPKVTLERNDTSEYGFMADVVLRRPKAVEAADNNKTESSTRVGAPKSSTSNMNLQHQKEVFTADVILRRPKTLEPIESNKVDYQSYKASAHKSVMSVSMLQKEVVIADVDMKKPKVVETVDNTKPEHLTPIIAQKSDANMRQKVFVADEALKRITVTIDDNKSEPSTPFNPLNSPAANVTLKESHSADVILRRPKAVDKIYSSNEYSTHIVAPKLSTTTNAIPKGGSATDVILRRPKAVETIDSKSVTDANMLQKEVLVLDSTRNESASSSDQPNLDGILFRSRSNSVRQVSLKIAQLQEHLTSTQLNPSKMESSEGLSTSCSDKSEIHHTNSSVSRSASLSSDSTYSDEPIYSNDLRRKPLEQQLSKEDIDELEKSCKKSFSLPPTLSNNVSKTLQTVASPSTKDQLSLNINQRPSSQQHDRRSVQSYGKVSVTVADKDSVLATRPQEAVSLKSVFSNRKSTFISSESVDKSNNLPPGFYRQSTDAKIEVIDDVRSYRRLSVDSLSSSESDVQKYRTTTSETMNVVKKTANVNPEKNEMVTENVPNVHEDKQNVWNKFGPRSSFKLRNVKPLPPERNVGVESPLRIQIVSSGAEAAGEVTASENPKDIKIYSFKQRPLSLYANLKINPKDDNSSSTSNENSFLIANIKKPDSHYNELSTQPNLPATEEKTITNPNSPSLFFKEAKWTSIKPLHNIERKPSLNGKLADNINIELSETKPAVLSDLAKLVISPKPTPLETTSNTTSIVTNSNIANESPKLRKTSIMEDSENPRIGSSFTSSINRRSSMKNNSYLIPNIRQNKAPDVEVETSKNAENSTGDSKHKETETDRVKSQLLPNHANGNLQASTTVLDNDSVINNKTVLQPKSLDTGLKPSNITICDVTKSSKSFADDISAEEVISSDKLPVPEWRKALMRHKEEKELKFLQEKEAASIQAATTYIIREPEVKQKQVTRKSKVLDMVDNYQNRQVY